MAKKARAKLTRKSNREVVISGERLLEARMKKGLTQADLAFHARIAAPDISDFERGIGTDLRSSGLKRLADVLGVSMDWLCGRD